VRAIAYVTDVEGRWEKLAGAVDGALVSLEGDALRVAEGAVLVFGGDAVDRGPDGRRILRALLAAKRAQPDRVVLLAGNRDLNKLRLARELTGAPPARAPSELRGGPLLRWILARTMGAPDAFEHRAAELGDVDEARVVESFLEDVQPDGLLTRYLAHAQLGFREGDTLFVHGAVTLENLGLVPGIAERAPRLDAWIARLDAFLASEVSGFIGGRPPNALMDYQRPRPGTSLHQASVVYGRPIDARGDVTLPPREVIERLAADGVRRVVLGHTPAGDCPSVLRDRDGFQLVLADTSYGRVEGPSRVAIEGGVVRVEGRTVLDGGEEAEVRFRLRGDDDPVLGLREPSSRRLFKARLARGDYLTFRTLDGREVEQRAVAAADVAPAGLAPP
jgi:hypothetical protein